MTQYQPSRTSANAGQLPVSMPLELSRRYAAIALAAVLLLAGGLLAKQIACSKIAALDACGYYMPLAKAYADGFFERGSPSNGPAGQGSPGSKKFANAQHIMIPPLYPMVVGGVSRLLPWADWPQEIAGRLVSAFFTLVLVLVVYWIGAKGWNRRVGLAAAALAAVNHDVIYFGASVGPEMMYAALLAMAVLGLVCYVSRPALGSAMAVGLAAALAALTRSEGLFAPVLAAVIMAAVVLIRRPPRRWRLLKHVLVMLCIVAAIWWPRTSYMHEKTGYYVMDVRLIKYLPGRHPTASRDALTMPNQIGWLDAPAPPHKLGTNFKEAQASLLMGFGPVTWILALCWFLCRLFGTGFHGQRPRGAGKPKFQNIPWQGLLQIVILVAIVTEIVMVAPVKLGNRYMVTVAGLAQIWGGLGMVAVAELARRNSGTRNNTEVPNSQWSVASNGNDEATAPFTSDAARPLGQCPAVPRATGYGLPATGSAVAVCRSLLNKFGGSLNWQMAALGLISAGLACWSLFAANAGVRRADLRQLAQIIVRDAGPGQVIMASTGSHEPGYYASGKLVIVRRGDDTPTALPLDVLTQACRKYSVRYIIFRTDEKWLPPEVLKMPGAVLAVTEAPGEASSAQPANAKKSYLIDARKLTDIQ